jgi:hypothetical protein
MISIKELEEFATNFNPDDYSHGELLTILGIAICVRTDIHKKFEKQRSICS